MSELDEGNVGEGDKPEDAGDLDYKVEFEKLKAEAEKKEKSFKKEIGGLDKKVTELLEAQQEKDEQLKRLERKNLPADRLREVLAQEEAQRIAQKDAELAQAKSELESYKLREDRIKILTQKKADPFVIRLLTENQPTDIDEYVIFADDIKAEFEALVFEKTSQFRVSPSPQTGGNNSGRKVAVPSEKDWSLMPSEAREAFAKTLTKEQLEQMIQNDMNK